MKNCEKLLLCPTEPRPAGSKLNLLLAKAKKISDGGNNSVIIYIRKKEEKSFCKDVTVARKERNNYRSTSVSELKIHRTTESFRVEKTSEIIESNL